MKQTGKQDAGERVSGSARVQEIPRQAGGSDGRQIVGVDWRLSGRHAYLLDAKGSVVRHHHDVTGIGALKDDAAEALGALMELLQADLSAPTDMILSGLAGAAQCWQQPPLLACDHPLTDLPQNRIVVESPFSAVRCSLVPGYDYVDEYGKPDMLQGEEMYLLGALASGAQEGWFIMPGTTSKWVRVESGCVAEILSFMTGEFFALLSEHGLLADLMQARSPEPQAFDAGVMAAGRGSLTRMAFECQALVATGAMPAAHVHSYLSGLLVGCEFHEIRQRANAPTAGEVHLIGDVEVLPPHRRAAQLFGLPVQEWTREQTYLPALRRLAGIEAGAPVVAAPLH